MMENTRDPMTVSDLFSLYGDKIVSESAPVDVDKLASLLDIRIEYDLRLEEDDIVGQISFENGQAVVKINPIQNSYNPRRRFTLAHEIGHFCLHSLDSKTGFTDSRKSMSRTDSYWDRYESEANAFAAQLLMPQDLIIERGNKIINNYLSKNDSSGMPSSVFIESMADSFDVSSKAMQYRLAGLGIIKS